MLNHSNLNYFRSDVHWFCKNHKTVSAPVIDGVSGSDNIANLWHQNSKGLYSVVDGSASTDVLSDIASVDLNWILVSSATAEENVNMATCMQCLVLCM